MRHLSARLSWSPRRTLPNRARPVNPRVRRTPSGERVRGGRCRAARPFPQARCTICLGPCRQDGRSMSLFLDGTAFHHLTLQFLHISSVRPLPCLASRPSTQRARSATPHQAVCVGHPTRRPACGGSLDERVGARRLLLTSVHHWFPLCCSNPGASPLAPDHLAKIWLLEYAYDFPISLNCLFV
jgi:hypothetical protein